MRSAYLLCSICAVALGVGASSCEGLVPISTDPIDKSDAAAVILDGICSRFESCRCDAAVLPAGQDCDAATSTLVRGWLDAADAQGLEYDGACLEKRTSDTCAGSAADCQIYFGDGALGDSCVAYGRYMSTCESTLTCSVAGVCIQPGQSEMRGSEGDRCGVARGDYATRCAEGLACAEGVCVRAADVGQACGATQPCDSTGWCSESTCTPRTAAGGPCESVDGEVVHEACELGACSLSAGRCSTDPGDGCVGFSW